jgi:glycine/D-amino acid oxidase-like deaminating enzyme
LVAAAECNGVSFKFGVTVEGVQSKTTDASPLGICNQIHTSIGSLDVDWLVVASGLGSLPLTASLGQPIEIKPVLGQALHLRLGHPMGNPDFQPVITGDDVHIVPVGAGEYWVGATVEFPDEAGDVVAEPALLEKVRQEAIAFCPALAEAIILRSWSGKRPRPEGRPAPVIGQLSGYSNVLLATGHYRNGVLLAPVTAQEIRNHLTLSV